MKAGRHNFHFQRALTPSHQFVLQGCVAVAIYPCNIGVQSVEEGAGRFLSSWRNCSQR